MRKALADSLSESQTLQDLTFWNYPSEIHQIRVEIIIKGKKKRELEAKFLGLGVEAPISSPQVSIDTWENGQIAEQNFDSKSPIFPVAIFCNFYFLLD